MGWKREESSQRGWQSEQQHAYWEDPEWQAQEADKQRQQGFASLWSNVQWLLKADAGEFRPDLEVLEKKLATKVQSFNKPPTKEQLEGEFQALTQRKKAKQEQFERVQKEKESLDWKLGEINKKLEELGEEIQQLDEKGQTILKKLQPMNQLGEAYHPPGNGNVAPMDGIQCANTQIDPVGSQLGQPEPLGSSSGGDGSGRRSPSEQTARDRRRSPAT